MSVSLRVMADVSAAVRPLDFAGQDSATVADFAELMRRAEIALHESMRRHGIDAAYYISARYVGQGPRPLGAIFRGDCGLALVVVDLMGLADPISEHLHLTLPAT